MTTVRELTQAFARADLGHLHFGKDLTIDQTTDCAHPIVTTRMASTPATGVVDRDFRVFADIDAALAAQPGVAGRARATVGLVDDGQPRLYVRLLRLQPVEKRAGAVGRAVVDRDDLERPAGLRRNRTQRRLDLVDDVVRRHNDACETAVSGHCGRLRQLVGTGLRSFHMNSRRLKARSATTMPSMRILSSFLR